MIFSGVRWGPGLLGESISIFDMWVSEVYFSCHCHGRRVGNGGYRRVFLLRVNLPGTANSTSTYSRYLKILVCTLHLVFLGCFVSYYFSSLLLWFTAWWFQTLFPIIRGMSSFPSTFIFFQRGRYTTNQFLLDTSIYNGMFHSYVK